MQDHKETRATGVNKEKLVRKENKVHRENLAYKVQWAIKVMWASVDCQVHRVWLALKEHKDRWVQWVRGVQREIEEKRVIRERLVRTVRKVRWAQRVISEKRAKGEIEDLWVLKALLDLEERRGNRELKVLSGLKAHKDPPENRQS
jgi:beta-xylosidase